MDEIRRVVGGGRSDSDPFAALVAAVATCISAAIASRTQRRVAAIQPMLEELRHTLAAQLAFVSFRRERLNRHLGRSQLGADALHSMTELLVV